MKKLNIIAGLLLAILASGCATNSALREVKRETVYLRTQFETMREDQKRLAQAIVNLQTILRESSDASNQLRADMKVQLDRLARESQILSARLEDADQRISKLPGKIQIVAPPTVSGTDSTGGVSDSLVASLKNSFEDAKALYEDAYQDLIKGQYKLAETGFQQYLQLNPTGDLSDNAQYWIGECYYAQQFFPEASQAFKVVVARFPDGDKVPAAMLKLGYCQIALGERKTALETLQNLAQKYPFSNEAKLAQAKIQELRR